MSTVLFWINSYEIVMSHVLCLTYNTTVCSVHTTQNVTHTHLGTTHLINCKHCVFLRGVGAKLA